MQNSTRFTKYAKYNLTRLLKFNDLCWALLHTKIQQNDSSNCPLKQPSYLCGTEVRSWRNFYLDIGVCSLNIIVRENILYSNLNTSEKKVGNLLSNLGLYLLGKN